MSDIGTCVSFLQKLIRTESLPGQEGEIAQLVRSEMEALGYSDVRIDEAGNVIGRIPGNGSAPVVMFNTHLDHVDVGDHAEWPFPPFGGTVYAGRVWGRGAMDIKGPLAAQVHGLAPLLRPDSRPPGDVFVSAVVQEEVGGLGARYLARNLPVPLIVVGEASANQLRRGHRGRLEFRLQIVGKSVHASVPANAVNPLFVAARFLQEMGSLKKGDNPDLGPSSVAPTLFRTDQISPNVTPGQVWLTCDWRCVPGERAEEIRERIQALAQSCLIPGARVETQIVSTHRKSYTGLTMDIPADNPAYLLPADHPAVRSAETALSEAYGRSQKAGVWNFATDGGHFAHEGMTVIGFGPGDEFLAHTNRESIALDDLEIGMKGNLALARAWPSLLSRPERA